MAASDATVLLLADISGFTEFMRRHAIASRHAREIMVRLLKAMIRVCKTPVRLAEVEGDAVFLFAVANEPNRATTAASVKWQMMQLFHSFRMELDLLQNMNVCTCEACANVGNLQLKQVVHFGEAAIEKVGRFDKLFSLDVILVHRLLKNSVPEKEYVLMTSSAYELLGRLGDADPEPIREEVDGIGPVTSYVFRGPALLEGSSELGIEPTGAQRLRWRLSSDSRLHLCV